MDNQLIADSSYLFSLAISIDSNNKKAIKLSKKIPLQANLIVPTEIFAETINTLWHKIDKTQAIQTANELVSGNYLIPETTGEIRRLALEKFTSQKKKVSYTDCLVMAFADFFKTKTILGFDEAFKKNGYTLP